MLITCFIISVLYVAGQCQNILSPHHLETDQQLVQCITGILTDHFSDRKELTYFDMDNNDEALIKTIHTTMKFMLISRKSTYQSILPNQGYLVTSENVAIFTKYFEYLITDTTWNPYAKFLIVIRSLQENELRNIFDVLLRQHVNNALVVNGTNDAHLYSYNPFDKYACGKYYNDVISFGVCSRATHDLYPNKLVTGLQNCTFRASLAHRPPFTIDPSRADTEKTLLGTEESVFQTLIEKEEFDVIYNYSYNGDLFSTVGADMKAIGAMSMLQNNETDIIFGAMLMITTRAEGFTYLCGYHDYTDELLFAVKKASLVPIWKCVYIEFDLTVWMLILLSFIVYSAMMIFLLRTKDKSRVMLELLDNLLLHGRHVRCRMTFKCVLLLWVWFAYLINTFYQSSLVSLTTNPSKEYQISEEDDLVKYGSKTCFSLALRKFLIDTRMPGTRLVQGKEIDECANTLRSIETVIKDKNRYTLVPNYFNLYYREKLTDKWGESPIYYFKKPYAKYLFGIFFYKGFPISHHLRKNSIRMRENGLADKSLNDLYEAQRLKQRYAQKEFEVRFTVPWIVFVVGCVISTATFIMELLVKYIHAKWSRR